MSRETLCRQLAFALRSARFVLLACLAGACLESAYVLRADPGEHAAAEAGSGAGGQVTAPDGDAGEPGSAGAGVAVCREPFRTGGDFAVCSARYLGSSGSDALRAAAVALDGSILVGGRSESSHWDAPVFEAIGDGTGFVARLSATGEVTTVARLGGEVRDLAVTEAGVVAGGDFGVALLDLELSELLQHAPAGEVTRLDGSNERVLALTSNQRAVLLDRELGEVTELVLASGEWAEDVALDAVAGLLVVTGSKAPVAGGSCQGRLPFIYAYDELGAKQWSAYGFDDAPGWCASSSGRRLFIAGGKLFYAGEQEGGNSVHLRDPADLSVQAPLVSYDEFSGGFGKATHVYSFVGRFELLTGALELGQVVLPREAGVGGTLFTSALAVDEAGRVLLGGQVSCCLARRDEQRVASQAVSAFAGVESSLLLLSADFGERLVWTTLTAGGPSAANVEALAVRDGLGVLVATSDAQGELITYPAGSSVPQGGLDGFVAIFPTPR